MQMIYGNTLFPVMSPPRESERIRTEAVGHPATTGNELEEYLWEHGDVGIMRASLDLGIPEQRLRQTARSHPYVVTLEHSFRLVPDDGATNLSCSFYVRNPMNLDS